MRISEIQFIGVDVLISLIKTTTKLQKIIFYDLNIFSNNKQFTQMVPVTNEALDCDMLTRNNVINTYRYS